MNSTIKDKSCLVYDRGMQIELAIRLSREFGTVYYLDAYSENFPKVGQDFVGYGYDEIKIIPDIWEVIDKCDCFIFPDTGDSHLQEYLRSIGKNVWGSAKTERFEVDRWLLKNTCKQLGLPIVGADRVKGVDHLMKYLKNEENKFIKISTYRGIFETEHFINYRLSQPFFAMLKKDLGAFSEIMQFIIEDEIPDATELGIDTICVDGEYPKFVIEGAEIKDCGYAGQVCAYEDVDIPIKIVSDRFAPIFEKEQYRCWMSNEVRITKNNVGYLIDLTARSPNPPGDLEQELISNLGEIIYYGSQGVLIEPEYEANYGLQMIIHSDEFSKGEWIYMQIPEEQRQFVKLKYVAKVAGTEIIIPNVDSIREIGSVVAFGDSYDECFTKLKKTAEEIKGVGFEVQLDAYEKAIKAMNEAKIENEKE